MHDQKEWFSEWFDSPYYHILYHNRDEQEAERFLRNLVHKLPIQPGQQVVDLACGKGRHAIVLNSLGCDVTGVDLSAQSISHANQFANSTLRFELGDLRSYRSVRQFDVALNLFTSFGYFQSEEEDLQVLSTIHRCLKPNGIVCIDFFNPDRVLHDLIEEESKTIHGIQFHISRWADAQFVYKKIRCTDSKGIFEFTEKVQLIGVAKFTEMLHQTGFQIQEVSGNYDLEPFKTGHSERLIIIAKRL